MQKQPQRIRGQRWNVAWIDKCVFELEVKSLDLKLLVFLQHKFQRKLCSEKRVGRGQIMKILGAM